MKSAKVGEWITHLVGAGLIDRDGDTFRPHNWNERQYKTDTADPTAASRAKRYRDRKRDARDATVTAKRPDTDTDTDTDTEQNDVADDARVVRGQSLISEGAIKLADALLVIAGHDLSFPPPGWCGAAMRVQSWLSEGWKPEIIIAAVRGAAAKKHGKPANSVQFFENAIAEEVARQAAPLPKVEIREAKTITVNHGTTSPNSLIGAINRELAAIEAEARADSALPENPVLRLSN
jgi:hypothetical protein